ncbi:MAG: orotidine 5'-phosphate decarboxylase [Thaumarchaeota archaeon]|nr:orotidine 5'-phosphate decarboxylase [Nitrososphaerota archaeon]
MGLPGYTGKILRVNLTTGDVKSEPEDPKILYNFIGARGLAEWIYVQEADPNIDPLSPENKLVLMAAPLTGSQVPGTGRIAVVSKSPLTNTLFESSLGGFFGAYMRWAGWDGIILEGKAQKPSFLLIDGDKVSIHDASDLWGKQTSETEEHLQQQYPKSKILEIGPAGENKVPMASIMHDTRTAGRGGMGAIMGSKNLKAIVAQGSTLPQFANKEAYERGVKSIQGIIMDDPVTGVQGSLATFGTSAIVHRVNDASTTVVNNFSETRRLPFEVVDKFSGETVREKYFYSKSGCYRCSTVCGRVIKVDGKTMKGAEYETVVMLGPNAGFHDYVKEIIPLSILCDELGLDTISVGNMLGFAISTGKFNGGLGSEEMIQKALKFVEDIAYNRTIFSKGVAKAAKELGIESKAMHVKGLEMPAYHPKGAYGMALNYATTNKGADHTSGYTIAPELFGHPAKSPATTENGKAHLVIRMQDAYTIYDSADMCIYHSIADFDDINFDLSLLAKMLTAATGFKYDSDKLHEIGSRIWSLERLFNQKTGFTSKDDTLPPAIGMDINKMLNEYYTERGWANGHASSYPELREPVYETEFDIFIPVLKKLKLPQIQVALDVPRSTVEHIASIAKAAYQGGARIIEAGTPAAKMHDLRKLIGALREAAPESVIVADLKTYDMGKLEAEIAIDAGADVCTVLGKAGKTVIKEALSEARRREKAVEVDLMGCTTEEIVILTKEFRKDADYLIFSMHLGVTQQMQERGIYSQKQVLENFVDKASVYTRAVAGGLKEGTIEPLTALGIDVLIIGSAIYNASDPTSSTRRILEEAERGLQKRTVKASTT